ncbi:DUF1281 family ferredoxin-like fold protein [Sphingobacterium sp. NPDC055431]
MLSIGHVLQYETKWVPNFEVLKVITDYFKKGFKLDYEEMRNLIYGTVQYKRSFNGRLFD